MLITSFFKRAESKAEDPAERQVLRRVPILPQVENRPTTAMKQNGQEGSQSSDIGVDKSEKSR